MCIPHSRVLHARNSLNMAREGSSSPYLDFKMDMPFHTVQANPGNQRWLMQYLHCLLQRPGSSDRIGIRCITARCVYECVSARLQHLQVTKRQDLLCWRTSSCPITVSPRTGVPTHNVRRLRAWLHPVHVGMPGIVTHSTSRTLRRPASPASDTDRHAATSGRASSGSAP